MSFPVLSIQCANVVALEFGLMKACTLTNIPDTNTDRSLYCTMVHSIGLPGGSILPSGKLASSQHKETSRWLRAISDMDLNLVLLDLADHVLTTELERQRVLVERLELGEPGLPDDDRELRLRLLM